MNGGPSHVDTFDYKPLLKRDHGKPSAVPKPRVIVRQTGNLLKSPWKFQQYGKRGLGQRAVPARRPAASMTSCFVHSVHGTNPRMAARS